MKKDELNTRTRVGITVIIGAAIMAVMSLPVLWGVEHYIHTVADHTQESCYVVDKQVHRGGRGYTRFDVFLEFEDGTEDTIDYCGESTFNNINEGDTVTVDIYKIKDKVVRVELPKEGNME